MSNLERATISFRFILPIMVSFMVYQNQQITKSIENQTQYINSLNQNLSSYKLEVQGRVTKIETELKFADLRMDRFEKKTYR